MEKIKNIFKNEDRLSIYIQLDKLTKKEIDVIKKNLDDAYYNGIKSLISDSKYDILLDYILERFPRKKLEVGCKIREGIVKVKLPYYMGSLDKKKESKQIDKWLDKYPSPYVISEKLDGISMLISVDSSNNISLYTRGDGYKGSDIGYLQKYLNLPRLRGPLTIRGELIVSLEKYKSYSSEYDNPRQMVAGIVNSNTLKKGMEDIEFIAHQIVDGNVDMSSQFRILKELGFKIPKYIISDKINSDILSNLLKLMKTESAYCIDGIVVTTDRIYSSNAGENPKHSWAFKMSGKEYDGEVTGVEWNLSKSGILKPIVKIKPVVMDEVTVSNVTGFNAKYILDNSIGIGTLLKIIRSGDVIPHITRVVKPTKADMPKDYIYDWNSTGVDIVVNKEEYKDEYNIKQLSSVVASLKIANLGKSTIEKLYNSGWNSLYKILSCEADSFKDIPRLGERSSERIYQSVKESLENLTPETLISAFNALGQGISNKKIEKITEVYPNIFTESVDRDLSEYSKMLGDLKGFSDITINKICENIYQAKNLVKQYSKFIKPLHKKEISKKVKVNYKLEGMRVLFTGFRDNELSEKIISRGGKVSGAYKSITHLIIPEIGYTNKKVDKAEEDGVLVLDKREMLKLVE